MSDEQKKKLETLVEVLVGIEAEVQEALKRVGELLNQTSN